MPLLDFGVAASDDMTNPTPDQPGLTLDDVRSIAALCRVGMSDDDLERMREELDALLAEVAVVRSIDTEGIEPTGHAVDGVHTVLRDDVPTEPLSVDDVLSNAPRREGDYFRVRRVLE